MWCLQLRRLLRVHLCGKLLTVDEDPRRCEVIADSDFRSERQLLFSFLSRALNSQLMKHTLLPLPLVLDDIPTIQNAP